MMTEEQKVLQFDIMDIMNMIPVFTCRQNY